MKPPVKLFRLSRALMAYKRRSETLHAMPIRLWIETSGLCNLECTMCPNKDLPAASKTIMELPLFENIIDEASAFVNDVYLHHRGEPFINPQLFSMIRYAEDAGIRTRFHTNGTMMTAGRADRLLEAAPSMVSFSVDGFAKAPYEQIRQGAAFDKTLDNIRYLATQKQKQKCKKPYLVVERIRFKNPPPGETDEAVAALRRELLEAGIDEVIAKDEYDWATHDAADKTPTEALNCCTFPWYAMVICADGTVTPCPQDFHASLPMGNVRNATLRDIWNDKPYRALRRAFNRNAETPPLCRNCDRRCRETMGGVPLQYAKTFLVDQFVGYGKLRKTLGTAERR